MLTKINRKVHFSTLNIIQRVKNLMEPGKSSRKDQKDALKIQTEIPKNDQDSMEQMLLRQQEFTKEILSENKEFQRFIIDTPQFKSLFDASDINNSMRMSASLRIGGMGLTEDFEYARKLVNMRREIPNLSKEEEKDIEFFDHFFDKIAASERNDKDEFDRCDEKIRQLAEKGSVFAQFHVAQIYYHDFIQSKEKTKEKRKINKTTKKKKKGKVKVEEKPSSNITELADKMISYLLSFASTNTAEAAFMIAEIAENSPNTLVTKEEALEFYFLSASCEHPEEEVNADLAFKYLKEASLNHHSEAQMLLASYYKMHGNGLMSMAWLLELSSLGSMEACNEIVDLWLEGSSDNTVKPDPFKAIMNIVKLRDANYPEWQTKWDIAVEALKNDPRYSNDINNIISNI